MHKRSRSPKNGRGRRMLKIAPAHCPIGSVGNLLETHLNAAIPPAALLTTVRYIRYHRWRGETLQSIGRWRLSAIRYS